MPMVLHKTAAYRQTLFETQAGLKYIHFLYFAEHIFFLNVKHAAFLHCIKKNEEKTQWSISVCK